MIEKALAHTESQLSITLEESSLNSIIDTCNGDVRMAYNILNALNIAYPNQTINLDHLSCYIYIVILDLIIVMMVIMMH